MLIKDIKPDAQSANVDPSFFFEDGTRDTIIKDRKVLDLIVDKPCIAACKYLFDCNILTQNSSANQNDLSTGVGYITIDYKSLDDHNKKVYEDLLNRGIVTQYVEERLHGLDVVNRQHFTIEVPLNENTDSEEFSNLMLEIAKNFSPQEILYGFYTQEEMEKIAENSLNSYYEGGTFEDYLTAKYGSSMTYSDLTREYAKAFGFYHDEGNNRYWISEELYKKSINKSKDNIL